MTGERADRLAAFLADAGWSAAIRQPLAGDASARIYTRLGFGDRHAVLMDADPATGERTEPFIRITGFLSDCGLSAPAILASDPEQGFLLLEDLGDDLFADVITRSPEMDIPLARAAADVLVHLQAQDPPDHLSDGDTRHFVDILDPFFTEYLPAVGKPDSDRFRAMLETEMAGLLEAHAGPRKVLVMRDFHAENLIWLPHRDGVARVGLLDYQDALAGPAAYDLASYVLDARRDVPPETAAEMIRHFAAGTGADLSRTTDAVAVYGLQRNLRILGIFHRLARVRGKPAYLGLVPRVRDHIINGLDQPVLRPLACHLKPVFNDA